MKNFWTYVGQKTLLESYQSLKTIEPEVICNFYYIWTGLLYDQIEGDRVEFAKHMLGEIQRVYVDVFTNIFINQLAKYYGAEKYTGRYGSKPPRVDLVQGKPEISLDQIRALPSDRKTAYIAAAMKRTYRSDMVRRNDLWNMAADYLHGLATTGKWQDVGFYIDRLNNAVHHTGGSMMEKVPGIDRRSLQAIINTFDKVHNAKIPAQYGSCVSPEVRNLYRHWTGPR